MRIACLQFAPVVGDIDNNLSRADAVLSRARPEHLDLMVLPELAFSGYNFKSLNHISPYLEPTTSGISSLWARTIALKHECFVVLGYPEKVDMTTKWPASPEYYNSAVVINRDGETIANYRKKHLYYTDETWALEGVDGFFDGEIEDLGSCALGICMDLNPCKFQAPWSAWEFAYHVLHTQANLVILSMAWNTREDRSTYSRHPMDPDMETLSYWLARLEPLIRAEQTGEIIVVICNRTGVEDDAVYAGTSAVLGIEDGEVKVYGVLGRGQKELLVVDTDDAPIAKLVADHSVPASESNHASDPAQHQQAGNPLSSPVDKDRSIDAIINSSNMPPISPIAPVDQKTVFPYFKSEPEDTAVKELPSSIQGPNAQSPIITSTPEDSPSGYQRPFSPKSRNCSRTRPIQQQPALHAHDLAHEPEIIKALGALQVCGSADPNSASTVLDQPTWDPTRSLLATGSRQQSEGNQSPPRPKSLGW